MVAYTYRMPAGIAGAISRPQDLTTEPAILSNASPFVIAAVGENDQTIQLTAYGVPGKYDDDGLFVPLAANDGADDAVGFFVRPYPTTGVADFQHQVHTGAAQEGDVLKRGYLNVNVGEDATEIKRGAPVYFDASTQRVLQDSETDSDSSATPFAVPTAYFTGPGDADGNVEIAYNI